MPSERPSFLLGVRAMWGFHVIFIFFSILKCKQAAAQRWLGIALFPELLVKQNVFLRFHFHFFFLHQQQLPSLFIKLSIFVYIISKKTK
jgi:hypothetical protein